MNDDDVNRMFGWALFKVQKKYTRLSKNDIIDTMETEKLKVISDMSVNYKDIVHDEKCMRLYYPLDESIRNRGNLTLIHPSYCHTFSSVLENIKRIVKYMMEENNNVIPDKDAIKERLGKKYENDDTNDIYNIMLIMKKRVITPHLDDDELQSIVWELIERVMNAAAGEYVRNYRRQVLVRVNTVAFRTELAVKSEKNK